MALSFFKIYLSLHENDKKTNPVLALYVVLLCERGTIFQWKVIIIINERSFFSIKNGI